MLCAVIAPSGARGPVPDRRHRVRGGAAAARDARARVCGPAPRCPATSPSLQEDGTAAAPANAPEQVKQAIWAANSLQELPYRYGGGHNLKFDVAKGADCSGTVSFALKAAGLLKTPLDSGSFMKWGEQRQGRAGSRSSRTRATPTS